MPSVPAPAEVLVTGASGFLGAHVCRAFLLRGYNVRGTVRTSKSGDYLGKMFESEFRGKFTYVVVKDIAVPGAFDQAVKGVDAIAHTASPFLYVADDADPDVLIKPAVQGTMGILESAKKYGTAVRRILVTSSVSAIDEPRGQPYTYTTDDWNNKSVEEVKAKGAKASAYMKYCASKTLGERALWDFLSDNKDVKFDGVTTNTPFLYGPVIHEMTSLEKMNTSTKKLWDLLADPMPERKDDLANWVGDHLDVRDVAEASVDAIAREELGGRRLLMACGPLTRQDFLDVGHRLLPKLPKLPFEIPHGQPGCGDAMRYWYFRFDATETQKLLGREFRQLPEMIQDTLQSLADKGLLEKQGMGSKLKRLSGSKRLSGLLDKAKHALHLDKH